MSETHRWEKTEKKKSKTRKRKPIYPETETDRAGAPGIHGEEKRQTIPKGDLAIEIHRSSESEVKTRVAASSQESETPSLPVHQWKPTPNTKFVG